MPLGFVAQILLRFGIGARWRHGAFPGRVPPMAWCPRSLHGVRDKHSYSEYKTCTMIRYRPAAPLDALVQCFWWSQREVPQDYCEHILPSGGAQLVVALHDTPITYRSCVPPAGWMTWSGGIVHGPQSMAYIAGPKPTGAVVGVAFRAGAAGAVLGVSPRELADQHVDLQALWGTRGKELLERLRATANPKQIFRILEHSLKAQLQPSLLMHPAVARAITTHAQSVAPVRMVDLQRAAGYSPRHFIDLFKASVGLTPKQYFRIQRFNAVLRGLAPDAHFDLAQIAASVGYSDQAHLTREFREFAGFTPTQYRPSGPDRPMHHKAVPALQHSNR